MPTRRTRSVVITALLALAATACGSGAGTVAAKIGRGDLATGVIDAELIRSLGVDSVTSTSGRFTQSIKVGISGAAVPAGSVGEMTISSDGEFNGNRSRVHMKIDAGDLAALAGGGANGQQVLGALAQDNEVITDGSVQYYRGGLSQILGGSGSDWIKIDMKALAPGSATANVAGVGQAYTAQQLMGILVGTDGSVANIGTEDLRGLSCRHLRATVSWQRLVDYTADESEKLSREVRNLMAAMSSELGGQMPDFPVDVWVCPDGLVHRLEMTMALGPVSQKIEMEIYDLGENVTIDVPSNAREVDASRIMGGLGGN